MAKKAPQSFREVAQIVINLRNNPNQICIRFDDMRDAMKQYDKLDAAMRKPTKVDFKGPIQIETVLVTGPILTATLNRESVEAWMLVSIDALNRMMSQPPVPISQ